MDKERANQTLERILAATDDIRSAEIRQAVALADLAETYSVDMDTLVPELAEKTIHPGGDGTPGVSEFLCLELGPALGVSRRTAFTMVAGVLQLKHRHPRTWDSFLRGLIPRWQAEALAAMTGELAAPAAAWVDERVARSVGRLSFQRLKRLTRGWVAQADPQLAAEQEAAAREAREVVFGSDLGGTTDMWASLASRDAAALQRTLGRLAEVMGESGDGRTCDQRRAAALGMLSDPATALSWLTTGTTSHPTNPASPRVWNPKGRTVVYVHLAEETVVDPDSGVARIEGFGPLTVASLPEFLAGTRVTVRPVVDDSNIAPVDSYEIPEQVRDAVRRGSPYEAFPFSSSSSEHQDLDHLVAYRFGHLWESGQTSVRGLAPFVRLVHRAKTLGAWKVRRRGLVELCWTSPLGRTYIVGPRGTRPSATMVRRRE
ncbi:MAG: DUF222 domain-containing protein [Arachnia sp.]